MSNPALERGIRLAFVVLLAVGATNATADRWLIPIADSSVAASRSSNPRSFLRAGSLVFFAANDGVHGEELWRTDGTAAGTFMVGDLLPGAAGSAPVIAGNIGDAVIASINDGSGHTIWRSDGTETGTYKIGVVPRPKEGLKSYVQVVTAETRAFVLVDYDFESKQELWVTDGTPDGFRKVGVLRAFFSSAAGVNGKVYFLGLETSIGWQLWVSDGTPAGTHRVTQDKECSPGASCGTYPSTIFRAGTTALFYRSGAGEIHRTDGTPEGTEKLAPLTDKGFTVPMVGREVAYVLSDLEIVRTDGTAAGTRRVPFSDWYWRAALVLDDDRLVLLKRWNAGFDVWTSDATADGTSKIAVIPVERPSNTASDTLLIGALGTRVFAAAWTKETGTELWSVDLVTGESALLKDLDTRHGLEKPNSGSPLPGISLGSKLLFTAVTSNGRELWVTDGTTAGTVLLANIAPEVPAGVISGTVRDAATGAPIPGASMTLCAEQCDDVQGTDAAGRYRFESVLPGAYTLFASTVVHVTQTYDGINCPCHPPESGTKINVAAGLETAGVDFSLIKGGTLSGRVQRAATGEPVDGTQLYVRNGLGEIVDRIIRTDTDGNYRSRGLPAGTYYVETHLLPVSGKRPAVDQVFNGHNCPPTGCDWRVGDPVSVTLDRDTPGIDLSLHELGTIAGTVRDASNAAPVAGIFVNFIRKGSSSASASSKSNAEGRYISPLLMEGSYYVTVDGGRGYGSVVYPNGYCPLINCDPAAWTAVRVTIDGAVTGIDLLLPQAKARLTGIIRDRVGVPISNVAAMLLDKNGASITKGGWVITDSSGRYELFGYPTGTYYLRGVDELYPNVDCPSLPCQVADATGVALTEGQTTTVDMNARSQYTVISGSMLDAHTNQPMSGAYVYLFGVTSGRILGSAAGYSGRYCTSVTSRETSFYLVAGESEHRRTAYPNVRVTACTSAICPIPQGAVPIPAGRSTGIDFLLPRFGVISGTVKNATTKLPIAKASVYFVSSSGALQGGMSSSTDGRYVWKFADGPTYVYVREYPGFPYNGQAYPGSNCGSACHLLMGDLVNAPDGVEITGIDFHLQRTTANGKISGRVTDDATGQGIPNVAITARSDSGKFTTRTDAEGYYMFPDNPYYPIFSEGDYQVSAQPEAPYGLAISQGGTCDGLVGCAVTVRVWSRLPASKTIGIDFHLVKH